MTNFVFKGKWMLCLQGFTTQKPLFKSVYRFIWVVSLLILTAASGCQSPEADLRAIYEQSALSDVPDRNPVIVIPGILGSRLHQPDDDRVVWGAFVGTYANPTKPDGARLMALPINGDPNVPLRDLVDDVYADGTLEDIELSLFGVPVQAAAYVDILTTLGVGGFRDRQLGRSGAIDYGDAHYTCFQFSYDWRRDIVESAQELAAYIENEHQYVLEQTGHDMKFDIVAHSMGGLVARYYMMFGDADLPADGSTPKVTWAGAKRIDRMIIVGTPNAGSILALKQLIVGNQLAPVVPRYDPVLLSTMPSIYQLLPRPRHKPVPAIAGQSYYDPEVWVEQGWGMADGTSQTDRMLEILLPEIETVEARRAEAIGHMAKCLARAEHFHRAIDQQPPPLPAGSQMVLFAGDSEETPSQLATRGPRNIQIVGTSPGDGTVTRASILMDERLDGQWQPRVRTTIPWSSVHFLFTDHLGLTKSAQFSDNVLYLLLESPR